MQSVKDTDLLKKLGGRIRELRLANGQTQEDLAQTFNNHGEQIGRIERGQLNVSICTLYKIASGLGVNLSTLLAGID